MRNRLGRLGAAVAGVVLAVSAVGGPAGAATGDISASCEVKLYSGGVLATTLTVPGGYRLLGTIPATSPTTAPLTARGWAVSIRMDLDVLGPELAARGVTAFDQAYTNSAHLAVSQDGVEDWPQNVDAQIGRGFPVSQLGTGVTGPASDKQIYPGASALPGTWRFSSYGDISLSFHDFHGAQTYLSVRCVADPGQDLFWGETVVS
ncbi:hypothetical protein [Lentzea sp. NPDC059081]|uniref:hypothetical protein n=1 Tax=Lentzea sp. NPDC059081 TaxID=3346719 RepID=UPI00369FBA0C